MTDHLTVYDNEGGNRILDNENVWSQSETIMNMVDRTEDGIPFPLGKDELNKVVEWMEKMATFKTDGTSDEGKRVWINEYLGSMDSQDQLPLLFKTMTAANYMGVRDLLDQLCKFLANMIAQRTPNEILDYFNIKKITWEEEQELIGNFPWIDPGGLILKDRQKRLSR